MPLVFLLLGLAIVLWLGLASRDNEREQIALETRITAEQLKIRLEACFDARAGLVRTLADYPWQSGAQVLSGWTGRAGALLPLYDGVQALNFVDAQGVIRVVYPAASNAAALGANLRNNVNASVRDALERSEATEGMTRTRIIELLQSGKGFALYRPIRSVDGTLIGFANGVFRVEALMASCLPDGRMRAHFAFALSDDGRVFYEQADPIADGRSDYQVELEIDITGAPWRFSFAPLTTYLKIADSILDEIWTALGALLVTLLAVAMRFVLTKQRDIEDSEDKYRLLVENQTDMVVKVNPQGEFQYISPSYCEVFGKSEEALLGRQFLPLVHEDDRELTARSLESLKQPPHTSYHEQRAMTKEGWRWIAWSNRAVIDAHGQIVAITAVGRDVTDVKRLEERVAHAQKMRAMGELAGGITHDFNNLLQVIVGNIEFLLLDEALGKQTRDALQQVRNVAGRAMNLTGKLSTLSRQELTRPEIFDCNALVDEVEALLAHTLPASIELSLELADAALPVNGDRSQLEQVLLNLCFNARDAIDSKGHITVRTARESLDRKALDSPQMTPGDYAKITVEDDGHGIDAAILPRIFDPFFTTKATGTGTGLGLANCYTIVEQHRGMIDVDSAPGRGTRFSVYLPLSSRDERPTEPEPEPPRPRAAGAGKLVLIADDNPQLVALACNVLEKNGYECCKAGNGEQALALFESRRDEIRLVVLDLVMPGLSGQEVAARIRAIVPDVPILFVSGYVPEETKRALDEPVLKKPYTIKAFIEAVNDLLDVPA